MSSASAVNMPGAPPVPGVSAAVAPGAFGARRPDAIRVPKHFFPLKPREDEGRRIQTECAGTFREPRAYIRERVDGFQEHYVVPFSAGPGETLKHPYGHPNELEDRYEWFLARRNAAGHFVPVAPETGAPGEDRRVKVGFLKPDPHAADPATLARIQAELDARIDEHLANPEIQARLKALGYEPVSGDEATNAAQ